MLQLNQPRRLWPQLGLPKLFGPLLVYDLVRIARRKQQVVLRCLYAALLLGSFFLVYAAWAFNRNLSIRDLLTGAPTDPNALADFAEMFFLTFLGVQFAAACLLTPAWTAGAITEEKESRALEFLLSTDLRNREIVLSLAMSRLVNLVLVFLTGLPFLSLLQLLGGIDRPLLMFGFAVTGLTMVSLTALGVLVSVYAYHPRQAILRTYLWAGAYLVASGLSWLLLVPALGWTGSSLTLGGRNLADVQDLVEWANAGNPVAMAVQLYLGVQGGVILDTLLPAALTNYAVFHLGCTAVCVAWAVVCLRAAALAPPPGPVARALPLTRWHWRPRVGDRPMLWKEMFAEPGLRLQRLGRIAWGVVVPASFLPVLGILYYEYLGGFETRSADLAVAMNAWVRIVGTLVACLMLVEVALRAAGSVRGERDRQTLDSLLTTPLTSTGILTAKWLGSIAGLRRAWLWLGLIGLVGVTTGGLDWRAIPLLVLLWLTLAGFFASLGLWFSVVSATTQRAMIGTVLAVVGVTAGHWLTWAVLLPVSAWLGGPASAPDGLIELQALGLTPALTFAWLAYPGPQGGPWTPAEWDWAWTPIRDGLLCWAVGAVVLGVGVFLRFRRAVFAEPVVSRARSSWPRLRTCLVGSALAGFAGLLIWLLARFDSALDRWLAAVAEADRLDPGWRLDELEARRKVIPDEQNSLFVVPAIPDEQRTQSVPRWYLGKQWPTQDMEDAFKDLAPEVRLNDTQRRLLQKGLADVQPALFQARRLVDFPDGRNPITYSKDAFSTLLPYAQRNRTIATLLSYDAVWRAEEGDADGSLASCRAIINSGRCIGDEPTMISMLVRLACRGVALGRIERTLAQGEPSEEALAALQQLLEMEETEPLLLIGARGERAMFDRFLDALESGDVSRRDLLRVGAAFGMKTSPRDYGLLLTGLTIKSERAALLRFMTQYVEIAKLPVEERAEAVEKWAAQRDQLPSLARAMTAGPPRDLTLVRLVEIHRHYHTLTRCAIVMTALERYRRAHQRWPENLDALVPAFLPRGVPKDPYDGLPLRYRSVANGVVIYSVGPDGRDDGGVHLTQIRISSPGPPPAGTDVGFRLWDPVRRRQTPRTTPHPAPLTTPDPTPKRPRGD
jgi:ABC-type transport system involved in multi-copper enzyme maturation permease subunit